MTAVLSEVVYKAGARKVWFRLMPIIAFAYILNYLDRTNIALAKTHLMADLGISAAAFGLGAGVFFIAYCLLELPSNLMLHRFGARRWLSRIVVTWGLVSTLTMFVQNEWSFYAMRFLLGVAEAGFYPGLLFYITLWFAGRDRAVAVGFLLIAPQLATIFGSPLGGWIMTLDGTLGLAGWQWLLLIEGLPTILFGIYMWFNLPDGPRDAKFLNEDEKNAIIASTTVAGTADAGHHSTWTAVKSVFSSGILLSIAGIYFVTQLCVYGITFFMPSIVESFGVKNPVMIGASPASPPSVQSSASCSTHDCSASTAARSRSSRSPWPEPPLATLVASFAAPTLSVTSLAVMQFFVTGTAPVMWALAMSRINGVQAAAGLAMINSIGLLGGFFGPNIFGIADSITGNPASAIILLTVACVIALGIVALLRFLLARHAREAEALKTPFADLQV